MGFEVGEAGGGVGCVGRERGGIHCVVVGREGVSEDGREGLSGYETAEGKSLV